jgi:Domain of unknown function (DUF4132)
MTERDDNGVEREPVADTLPGAIRAELAEMRTLARPHLDTIQSELEADPTALVSELPALRRATDDEELRLALVAAALERHLNSGEEIWRTVWRIACQRRGAQDPMTWVGHPVIGALERAWAARWQEEHEARLAAIPAERPGPAQPSLSPHLDERLLGHRGAAEPWLARVEAMEAALRAVHQRLMDSVHAGEPLDHAQLLADADVEDLREIVRDLKREAPAVQVSVALACLCEELAQVRRASQSRYRLWVELNRRALPYEGDDLELALLLVDGHERSWFYGERLVRALDRHRATGGEIPASWLDPLRDMLAFGAGSRLAAYQKMAVTIRSLLGTGGGQPGAETPLRLDVSSLDADDAWSSTVRARLSEEYGADGGLNDLLGLLQDSGTGPRPGAAWRRKLASALASSELAPAALRMVLETAVEVRDDLVRRTDTGDWLYSSLGEPAALKIRAAAWGAQLSGASWAPDLVEQVAAGYAELLFDGKPHSARVANGAVSAVALGGTRDAVARLARLRRSMWHGSMQKHLDRELDSLAAAAGITRGQILELAAPDLGLGDDGSCTLAVGETGSLRMALDERCRLVSTWSISGGAAKASPAALRSAEPERVHELESFLKRQRSSLAAERDRIDGLLAEQPRWELDDWTAAYVDHPVLRAFGRALVWNVSLPGEIRAGVPGDEPGTFVDVGANAFAAPPQALVGMWHPVEAPDEEVSAWRAVMFERRVVQPVRQVFREVYRPAPDERGGARYTNRFAGQLLRHRALRGLLKRRDWKAPALLTWTESSDDVATAVRVFPRFAIVAELRYAAVWTEEALHDPGSYQIVSTDQLRFRPAGKDADALALEDVPAIVLSETMRDLDLFVSTCGVALDPAWQDVGDEALRVQWRELAFGELLESARIRRDVLEHTLPELSIADRCAVYDRELVVTGTRATYRIHIGTGRVRLDPHGTPLVLPERRGAGAELARLFLPVEADDTLSTVLGTAFTLANDDALTDEAVLSQLPRDRV